MSYQIRKSNGALLIDLPVGVIDQQRTSLTLVGKNVSEFGKDQNENFVHILENFAGSIQPTNALVGQLWFNSDSNQLSVNTTQGFKSIGPFANPSTSSITDVSTATATTAFVHQIMPKGMIVMWYGAPDNVPNGWALCDGQTVNNVQTPNLIDRFVIAAGGGFTAGDIGGRNVITTVPAHSHSFSGNTQSAGQDHSHGGVTASAGNHQHGYPGDDQLAFANGTAGWTADSLGGFGYDARSVAGGGGQVWKTTVAGNHNHTFDTGQASSAHIHGYSGSTSVTGSATVDILNPYYALAYIIKVI